MGRPSKLTDAQWSEIQRRLLAGEKQAALAREFGISKAALGERVSKRTETIRTVAKDIVRAEIALHKLPVSEQFMAVTLAEELKAISGHLAGAARFSAATSHRLAGIANARVQEVDDVNLTDESELTLKSLAVLQRMANDASVIPLNLLAANKALVERNNAPSEDEGGPASGVLVVPGVIDNPSAWTKLVQKAPQQKE
ncbi:MAG TPA: helix-turn-helix domain-containing protein [Burkholderiaceae bacterium]|nr:helix-turn-helix domain-containing protein [Burkholderiaceae bacterium]HQZ08283.1 helix-turn-helix domain-containing protein [Burkholderiaceae bacterium]